MIILNRLFSGNNEKRETYVQTQPNYYTTIDGTSEGITAEAVSNAITGNPDDIDKIYIGLSVGNTVKIKSIEKNNSGSDITGTPYFSVGLNPIPIKEVISDADNPTQIDIYY